jgi:putative colanic acid biosynthesis acetyltransferase WcaF
MRLLDAQVTRPLDGGASFSRGNRAFRCLWICTWWLLASWTPPFMGPWRRRLLILFGARIGIRSDVRGSARVWYPPNLTMGDRSILAGKVDCYNQGEIVIGSRTIISQKAYLCASGHEIDREGFQLITRPIRIGDGVWVASGAFVGPGTVVHDGAVVGACAVAFGTLDKDTVYIGNPAVPLRKRGSDAENQE